MVEQSTYKEILKSTFLFSFVRVFQILIGIIRSKVVAVLLGAEGIGVIGILTNAISLLQTGSGLGISQSAVRDISEANRIGNKTRFSRIISLTNNIILFTCLLGCLVTIILSEFLSVWTFGDKSYSHAYMWLALVVGLNILSEGQLAILKGMRQLRALAKASMIGSIVGLITSVPLYFFYGKSGIVPSLIISAISSVFFSYYYVSKIKQERKKLTLKEISKEASPMIKMGVALMFVGFLSLIFDLIVVSYIRSISGLEVVGYYRAGTTIISSYFGIVLTAMTTDYYPRISAVNRDNEKLQEELNRQTEVGLILIFPIAVLFVFLSPVIIQILYTKKFLQTIAYTDFAILGTIIIICSNNLGMILLAKQEAKIFTLYSILHRLLFIPIYLILYQLNGLTGLGISFLLDVIVQFFFYTIIIRYRYKIQIKKKNSILLYGILLITLLTIYIRSIEANSLRYILGAIIFLFSIFLTTHFLKNKLNMNIFEYIKRNKK